MPYVEIDAASSAVAGSVGGGMGGWEGEALMRLLFCNARHTFVNCDSGNFGTE
jgi:hypothetical protein